MTSPTHREQVAEQSTRISLAADYCRIAAKANDVSTAQAIALAALDVLTLPISELEPETAAAFDALPQPPLSEGWRPKTMTLNLTADEMAALEKLADAELPLGQLISALRSDEGDSVTLLSDNPEGPPNNAIECCGMWTGWIDRRFEGETLAAALLAAYRARQSIPDPPLSNRGEG